MSVRPDHPRCRIEIRFCVPTSLREIVLNMVFRENHFNSFRDIGVEIRHLQLLWPLYYTVQAVQPNFRHRRRFAFVAFRSASSRCETTGDAGWTRQARRVFDSARGRHLYKNQHDLMIYRQIGVGDFRRARHSCWSMSFMLAPTDAIKRPVN